MLSTLPWQRPFGFGAEMNRFVPYGVWMVFCTVLQVFVLQPPS
jgi:hypothetical protein